MHSLVKGNHMHLLVSVLLTRSGNFEQVRGDRQKGSIWPIIANYSAGVCM